MQDTLYLALIETQSVVMTLSELEWSRAGWMSGTNFRKTVNKRILWSTFFEKNTTFEHRILVSNFIFDTPWTSVLTLHSSTQNQRQGWYWLTSKIGIVQKYPLLEWAVSISKMQSSFPSRGEVKSKLWKNSFLKIHYKWYSPKFQLIFSHSTVKYVSYEKTDGT